MDSNWTVPGGFLLTTATQVSLVTIVGWTIFSIVYQATERFTADATRYAVEFDQGKVVGGKKPPNRNPECGPPVIEQRDLTGQWLVQSSDDDVSATNELISDSLNAEGVYRSVTATGGCSSSDK